MTDVLLRTARGQSLVRMGVSFDDLSSLVSPHKMILVTDVNVQRLYESSFPTKRVIVLPAGEPMKSLACVEKILRLLSSYKADKETYLIAVGGGVICDITGFVAAIYKRGIPFACVPTTLLSQVDAAIGGKNGINFDGIKNLLGTIRQPEFVLSDPSFLKTLPKAELVSAMAEVIKYGLISSPDLLTFVEENHEAILDLDVEKLRHIITATSRIKCAIVQSDEHEGHERNKLNFGHTFGHAIEANSGMRHGEAVSLGMILALKISILLEGLPHVALTRVKTLLDRLQLPVHITAVVGDSFKRIYDDKKRRNSTIDFILLKDVGEAVIRPIEIKYLEQLQAHLLLTN